MFDSPSSRPASECRNRNILGATWTAHASESGFNLYCSPYPNECIFLLALCRNSSHLFFFSQQDPTYSITLPSCLATVRDVLTTVYHSFAATQGGSDAKKAFVFKPTCLQRSWVRTRGWCTSVAVVLPHFPEENIGLLQVLLQLYGVLVVAVKCPH